MSSSSRPHTGDAAEIEPRRFTVGCEVVGPDPLAEALALDLLTDVRGSGLGVVDLRVARQRRPVTHVGTVSAVEQRRPVTIGALEAQHRAGDGSGHGARMPFGAS